MNTATSLSQGYPVHVGTWTNWSRGQILGATITLTRQNAALLIAFTSTFIAFVATRFWRLSCYALHRYYSTAGPQVAVYHQLQAILRNASAPEDGILLFLNLLRRKRLKGGDRRRLLFNATAGTVLLVTFIVAGGFSSRIATSDNEVLIESSRCGYIYTAGAYFATVPYSAGLINDAANYAQQCYSSEGGQFNCDRFVTERINASIDPNAPCPFDDSICLQDRGNIAIDSGYIDSQTDLGLNAPSGKRIKWRNMLHCAPLATAGFSSQRNQSSTNDTLYHYGNITASTGKTDYVYRARDVESQYASAFSPDLLVSDINYSLNTFQAVVTNGTTSSRLSSFVPINAIVREDADTYLVFLSGNGVAFIEPTDDVWYNVSTTPTNISFITDGSETMQSVYITRAPASPLGCVNRLQFCSTGTSGRCGPMASLRDAVAGAASLFNTTYDKLENSTAETEAAAWFTYFTNTFFSVDRSIAGILDQLGPRALLSQQNLISGFQGPLGSNQWQLDVTNWWNISMAITQAILLNSAYGPSKPAFLEAHVNYTTPAFENVCRNQKMKTTAYTSFSLFGLVFTYAVGFLLILTSYLLEPIAACLQSRKGRGQYKHLEWTTNATLQLQRLAHEGIRQGTWSGGTKTIPITKDEELLGLLDISNMKHPVLRPLDVMEKSLSRTRS